MNLLDAIHISLSDLYFRRFRTALATLGIVFGVAAVQAMLCIGDGAQKEALDGVARLGINKIYIHGKTLDKEKTSSSDEVQDVERRGLLLKDQYHIQNHFQHVNHVVAARALRSSIYSIQGLETSVSVMATQALYKEINSLHTKKGRFLHNLDEERLHTVCVVGQQAARSLFYFEDPIGKHITILGQPFTVVGVFENREHINSFNGVDLGKMVFIPLATAMHIGGDPYFDSDGQAIAQLDAIMIDCESPHYVPIIAKRVQRWLEKERRFEDCSLQIPLAIMKQHESTRRVFSLVMTTIAGISLLVGGIGIMNIMLANVSERKREIGTRRALGARRCDILFQFSFEASVLSGLGGLIGIALGYALTLAVSHYAQWPVVVTLGNISVGFISAVITGILFGWWPAHQAARVVPMEALRSL